MDDLIVQEKGYTVIYDTAKGELGYIGIDNHSGGYPFFSSHLEYKNVFPTIHQAEGLIKTAHSMKTYYGSSNVHYGTLRVVRVSLVFAEVTEDRDKIYFEETIKKLSESELDIIRRHYTEEK